jgi:hypothetical protein
MVVLSSTMFSLISCLLDSPFLTGIKVSNCISESVYFSLQVYQFLSFEVLGFELRASLLPGRHCHLSHVSCPFSFVIFQ